MRRIKPESRYAEASFSAPDERCVRFTHLLLGHVDAARPLRIMDIGCGTGVQIFHLAAALPNASFTGVDVSATNVDVARHRCRQLLLERRVEFVATDYMQFQAPPHDLIISYSTLHLIPDSSEALFRKISSGLVTGGLLVNVMPYECFFNRCLMIARRLFRLCRSPLVDAIVYRAGKALHGAALDDTMLRERVSYMYLVPTRLDGPKLRRMMLETCSLQFVAEQPEPHASIAQPKHRLAVFHKGAPYK